MLAFVGSTARSLGPLKSSPPSKLPIVTLLAATICAVDTVNKVDRKSTRLNSSHVSSSYAVFCLKKKTIDRKAFCAVNPPPRTHSCWISAQIHWLTLLARHLPQSVTYVPVRESLTATR